MDQTTPNGVIDLTTRINNPDTAAALNRLLDRIDALEQAVSSLTDAVQQAPGLIAMTGHVVDEVYAKAAASGIDLEARAATGLTLLSRLTEPQMAKQIDSLMEMAETAPGMVAMGGDMLDDLYANAASSGIDVESRLAAGLQLLTRLTSPQMMTQLNQLMDLADQAPGMVATAGDMLDEAIQSASTAGFDLEESAKQLGRIGKALAAAQSQPIKPLGTVGLLRAMGDPDVQRSLGMLINVAKQLGKTL